MCARARPCGSWVPCRGALVCRMPLAQPGWRWQRCPFVCARSSRYGSGHGGRGRAPQHTKGHLGSGQRVCTGGLSRVQRAGRRGCNRQWPWTAPKLPAGSLRRSWAGHVWREGPLSRRIHRARPAGSSLRVDREQRLALGVATLRHGGPRRGVSCIPPSRSTTASYLNT